MVTNKITSRQKTIANMWSTHCGAQNNANMACCVSEDMAIWWVGLRPSLANRTLGHCEH